MFQAIIEFTSGVIVYLVFAFLWWIILFPVVWLVSLPFILVFAPVRREPYHVAVIDMFTSVHHFWRDYGLGILP
jgi:hypothetical protein